MGAPNRLRTPRAMSSHQHFCWTVDGQAERVAKGRGALDVALGETFLQLLQGDRLMDLGYSRLVDYAFEQLGMPRRTAYVLIELARGLATRPLLRKAVAAGAVSTRKALLVMPLAKGEDEALWVGAAMRSTYASLKKQVEAEGAPGDADFEVETLVLAMTPAQQDVLDESMAVAHRMLGKYQPRWVRMECLAMEYLSSFPDWIPERREQGTHEHGAGHRHLDPGAKERISKTVRLQVEALAEAAGIIDRMGGDEYYVDAVTLDASAKRLARARLSRDVALGPLLAQIADRKVYREVGYTRFDDYCRDRLGMTARAARERIWLERKMCALPELREALEKGRISFSKALQVAKGATAADIGERIEDAATTTARQVEREATAEEERKNRAQGVRRLWGPKEAMETVSLAIATARRFAAEEGEEIGPGAALESVAREGLRVWKEHLKGRRRDRKRERIFARTGGICAVPVCGNPAVHLHHVRLRSQDGGDEEWNLIGLCASCHLRGIHHGKISVRGQAGEHLVWDLGPREGAALESWTATGADDVRRRA